MASSIYSPVAFHQPSPSYWSPYQGMKYKATPEDMNRFASEVANRARHDTVGGLARDRAEYTSLDRGWQNVLADQYTDMMDGGWGLSPEQQANYLDIENMRRSFDPEGQMGDWRSDTGNMVRQFEEGAPLTREAARALTQGMYDAVDPVAGYDERLDANLQNMWDRGDQTLLTNNQEVRDAIAAIQSGLGPGGPWSAGGGLGLYGARGAGGSFHSGYGGGAASVGGVDLSGLDLDPEFLANYKMTPEQKQALINLAMQGAGGRYRAGIEDLERRMAASGVANPYAMGAARERYERGEGQAADEARLAALVGGDEMAAGRLMNVENLRSGNERTRAGIMSDIAQTNARLQDSAMGRNFSAAEAATGRSFQAQMAAAAEAAAMERFYKDLGLRGNMFATEALSGIGDRELGWTQYGTNTTLGALSERERDLAERNAAAAQIGHGSYLANEQELLDRGLGMYGSIATGTQGVRNDIAGMGLDYSNALSQRYGNIYDFNQNARLGGVAGAQGMWDANRASRENTWNQTNQANQIGHAGQIGAIGQLGSYKNQKPLGFWDTLKQSAGGALGKAVGAVPTYGV